MKKTPRKKKLILWIIVVIVSLFGVLIYLEKSRTTDLVKNPFSSPTGPTKEQKAQEQKVNSDAKGGFLDSQYSSNPEQTPTNTPSSTPVQSTSNLELNAHQEGPNVVTTAKITGVVGGNCVLTVNNLGRTYSQTAEVIYQPEYSSCAGFGIPVSSVGVGTWSISLQVNGPGGSTVNKQINLEVR